VQAKEEVKKLIEKAQSNDLEAQPGRTIMESFENQVPVQLAAASPAPSY
jgi:DNA-directed RNA polymerase II subunit RPB1